MAEPWKKYKPWEKYGGGTSTEEKEPIETPEFEREAADITKGDIPDFLAGLPATRFAIGSGSFLPAAAQIAGNTADTIGKVFGMDPEIGKKINEHLAKLEEMKRRGMVMQGQKRDAWDVAGVGGAVASPAALGLLKALPRASTALARVKQGVPVGAGFGMLTPASDATSTADFWKDKVIQTGGGALFGAVIPPSIELAKLPFKVLHSVIEPWMQGGVTDIMKRTLTEALGKSRGAVMKALQEWQAAQKTPLAEGVTTAEAGVPAKSAELSAMKSLLQQLRPTEYSGIERAQNQAREAALKGIAGTDDELASAVSTRLTEAGKKYEEAFTTPMKWGEDAQKLAKDPFFGMAEKEASALIQKYGVGPEKNPVQYLHYIKAALDRLADKSAAKKGDSLAQIGTHGIDDTRKALMSILAPEGQTTPYSMARDAWRELSTPINQMQVGRKLLASLKPSSSEWGAETVPQLREAFLRAVNDQPGTIKSASGRQLFNKLNEIMNPEQMRTIADVARNLGAEAESNALGGFGLQNIAKAFSGTAREWKGLPVLNRYSMIGNAILGRLQGRANEKVLIELAKRFEDPNEIIKLLETMPPKQRAGIIGDAQRMAREFGQSAGMSGEEAIDAARRAAFTAPIVAGSQGTFRKRN